MNKIIIKNNKSCNFLVDEEVDFLYDLRQHLSYRAIGVEYTQAYKNGWDGTNYLMDKKNNFALGLLPRVEKFLSARNIKYELQDQRPIIEKSPEIEILETLKKLGKEPRDYQLAAVEAAIKNRKGIIRAATGGGKTNIAALISAKFNKPTIIYVIGLDLLKQFHDTFTKILKQPIGYIGNGICDIQHINIASVWTIGKSLGIKTKIFEDDEEIQKEQDLDVINKIKLKQLLVKTELHIFDECHGVACDTIKDIYKAINPVFIYGMSATPSKGDNTDLYTESVLGSYILDIPASLLIARGILAQPIIKFIDVPKTTIYSNTYTGVYSEYIVENPVRNKIILDNTLNLINKKYKILVLFKNIAHGKILDKLFSDNKIKFELLSGKDSLERRQEVKDMIESGKIDVILGSSIFDLGVDIPILSALILAGGGKSLVKTYQKVGRVIRGFPGKKIAAIVDFHDNVRYLKNHSKIRYNLYKMEKGFNVIPSKFMGK